MAITMIEIKGRTIRRVIHTTIAYMVMVSGALRLTHEDGGM